MKNIFLTLICLQASMFANAQMPSFAWAKGMAGAVPNSVGVGICIVTDQAGNVYSTGSYYKTTDFDPGAGVFTLPNGGYYLSKLDSAGNFVWAKQLASSANSIALDAAGNVYATGGFSGKLDFDPDTISVHMLGDSLPGGYIGEGFILKLDPAGNFVWVKNIGGSGGNSIAIDAAGNIYTMAYLNIYLGVATDCDPGPGIYPLTFPDSGLYISSFVSKLDASGNFVWAKKFVGNNDTRPVSIGLDQLGNVYLSGTFTDSTDFNPDSLATYNLVANNIVSSPAPPSAGFICKLDNSGNFIWAKSIGGLFDGSFNDRSMAVDLAGNVYSTGNFLNTVDMDPDSIGTYMLTAITSNTGASAFTLKLDSAGNFAWARPLTGALWYQSGVSIALDPSNNVYTTGGVWDDNTAPIDFDPGSGVFMLNVPTTACYVRKFDSAGNFLWAGCTEGGSAVGGHSISVDAAESIYTTGSFAGLTDFNPGPGVDTVANPNPNFSSDEIFVWKMVNAEVLGIPVNSTLTDISIYPNPTSGIFTLDVYSNGLQYSNIAVYNAIGTLVYQQTIANHHNTIDLTNQANGLYFLKVSDSNMNSASKTIIKK